MCDGIGDGAAEAVAHMVGLRQLDLSQNGRLTDVGVAALRPLTQLTSLVLNSSSQVCCRLSEPMRPQALMLLNSGSEKGWQDANAYLSCPSTKSIFQGANELLSISFHTQRPPSLQMFLKLKMLEFLLSFPAVP